MFEDEDIEAINAALAAGRPLLVRGEPGAGKSQLARAAAVALGRAFVGTVVDARTESRDLLWTFDAVRRLADAQVHGTRYAEESGVDLLDELRYTTPGPLWWAFHWEGASEQAARAGVSAPPVPKDCDPDSGVVVLIDEIDKADSSVPNGLLGALGDGRFTGPGDARVECGDVEPLVVVTTNEERSLPDAFLRRCLVHQMTLPKDDDLLIGWLTRRGQAHFPNLQEDVLNEAARMLVDDRMVIREVGLAPPGGAEYLDLLRIVDERAKTEDDQKALLGVVSRFVLKKHPIDAQD